MIHIIKEGKSRKRGFNFYPPFDRYSIGFVFLYRYIHFMVRYSREAKRWFLVNLPTPKLMRPLCSK